MDDSRRPCVCRNWDNCIGGAVWQNRALAESDAGDDPDSGVLVTDGGVSNGRCEQYVETCEEVRRTTRQLVGATDRFVAAEIAMEGIEDVFAFDIAGLWLADDAGRVLEPAVVTDADDRLVDGAPTYSPETESLSWDGFRTDTVRVVDDLHEREGQHRPETVVRSELVALLGEHGLLKIGATEPNAFTDTDVSCLEFWAETLTAVFGRIERERELRACERALQRERDRLEEFASVVSHDLRNPLNVATGRLELAAADCDSEHIAHAQRGLDRTEQLITDLLVLARMGAVVGDTEPVALAALADDCWETVQTSDATLTVTVDCPVQADEDRLARILEDLFRNAVEHGGDDVTVTVGELPDGFFVADDGPGIDEDAREAVFESGYSTSHDGTGLGLAIVRQIAEAHGWDVRATAATDGGARFEITGVNFA